MHIHCNPQPTVGEEGDHISTLNPLADLEGEG